MPNSVGRVTTIHLVSPSPACPVLVPQLSRTADGLTGCKSFTLGEVSRPGRELFETGSNATPQTPGHSLRPDLPIIHCVAERRALPPGDNVVVGVKLWS